MQDNNSFIYPYDPTISPDKAVAGDYAFYNGSKVVIVSNSTDLSTLPDNYVPIGVVVVPGTHNIYGDGSCGIASLKYMSSNYPDTGTLQLEYLSIGQYTTDLGLPTFDSVPLGNESDGLPLKTSDVGYLPTRPSGTICKHDSEAYYSGAIVSSVYIPSPYLTDRNKNLGYSQTTSPCTESNVLSDFDGINNSKVFQKKLQLKAIGKQLQQLLIVQAVVIHLLLVVVGDTILTVLSKVIGIYLLVENQVIQLGLVKLIQLFLI